MGCKRALTWAVFAALVWLPGAGAAFGQAGLPDAPAPAAQAHAPAVQGPGTQGPGTQQQVPGADSAQAPQAGVKPKPAGEANPFPEAEEKAAPNVSPNAPIEKPKDNDASRQNPFPDEEEKSAPLTGKAQPEPTPKPDAPAKPPEEKGWSSSDAKPVLTDVGSGADPKATEKRDVHDRDVARLYYNMGNWEGAYLRYRDAVAADPKDAEAAFGLAESERRMGRYVASREHYQKYLQLEPEGKHSKEARKGIASLPLKDSPQPQSPFAPKAQLP